MGWDRNTNSGVITKTTSAIEFALVTGDAARLPSLFRLDVQLQDIEHHVRVLILASGDGGSGWEIGIATDGDAAETDLMIRRRSFGAPANTSDNAAHSIAAATPYLLRIEILEGQKIVAYLILGGEIKASVEWVNTVDPTYIGNTAWGFISDVDGAVVLSAQFTALSQRTVNIANVLWSVAGGDLGASFDAQNLTLIQSRAFPGDVDISGVSFNQYVYFVGGGRARKLEAVTRVFSNWVPTAGTLPGQTSEGQTTANYLFVWGESIGLYGDRDAPNRIYLSAIGDAGNWNTASQIYGRALVINLPEPVVSVQALSNQVLLIVCTRSVKVLLGDPRLGSAELRDVSATLGGTGAQSLAVRLTNGRNLLHTAQGVQLVGVDGLVPLSYPVLRAPLKIAVASASDYIVQITHEPQNSLVFVFLTHRTDSTLDRMVVYHELVGGYDAMMGGWVVDAYQEDAGPMASCTWQGRAVLGGRDGQLRWFTDEEDLDDGTEAIPNAVPLRLIDADGLENDVVLHRIMVLLDSSSGPINVRVYGGANPQAAYQPTTRTLRCQFEATQTTPPIVPRVRDGALVAVLSSASDEPWAIQALDADVRAVLQHSRGPRPTNPGATAVSTPGLPPAGGSSTTPGGTGPDLPDNQPGGPTGTKVH